MASKIRLVGELSYSSDLGLTNAEIKFICTSSYLDILNTVETVYKIGVNGAYDFTVNYGVYTVQIRQPDSNNFRTIMANVKVATAGPQTLEQLIKDQDDIEVLDPTLIEQMIGLRNESVAARDLAKKWASNPEDVVVETGLYSARHYMLKTQALNDAISSNTDKAAVSAAAAKISETNAKASEVASKASETASKLSEQNAKASEVAAKASEDSATASKNAAKVSETNAKASEVAAKASETNSKTSETNAKASEVAAESYKVAAGNSAGNALASENKAKQWADADLNVQVEVGKYSSKHWATKSEQSYQAASISESNALASEQKAKASEVAAKASETASKASETRAVQAETTAITKAAEAASSATSANSSKLAAEEAARQAADSAAASAGSLIEAGNADLSSGVYPPPLETSTGVKRACFWRVTKGGTVDGIDYGIGDTLVYSVTLSAYYKVDNTESVTSVFGRTGAIEGRPSDVQLGNVNNTSDADKPISTAQALEFAKKADKTTTINGQPLSGNVTLTKESVGLGNVDNTSDSQKPVSGPQSQALAQKANTTYVDSQIASLNSLAFVYSLIM